MTNELLLKGGLVVTVDDSLGDLPDADVLIRDGVIVAVAPGLSASSANAEVIDCKGRLVIPGLVDTHRHVWQGAIGAFTPQMTGAGYGPAVLNGISTRYEPKDIYAGALWGARTATPQYIHLRDCFDVSKIQFNMPPFFAKTKNLISMVWHIFKILVDIFYNRPE